MRGRTGSSSSEVVVSFSAGFVDSDGDGTPADARALRVAKGMSSSDRSDTSKGTSVLFETFLNQQLRGQSGKRRATIVEMRCDEIRRDAMSQYTHPGCIINVTMMNVVVRKKK